MNKKQLMTMVVMIGLVNSFLSSCALTATRPSQEMSDMSAAIKAAREVNADTKTPELYQKASEYFLKARNEYVLKNFSTAKDFAITAKKFAEQAEFEALRGGAGRISLAPAEESKGPAPEPYDYPKPKGTPAFILEGQSAAPSGDGDAASPRSSAPPPP